VVVGDKVTGVVFFGKFQRRFNGAEVIADVENARGFDAGKGDLFHIIILVKFGGKVKAWLWREAAAVQARISGY
jgi:hypothetical protein